MQCAARSAPAQRSVPARRASTSFEPTPSVEATSSRCSSSAKTPAKAPKDPTTALVRVDSTAFFNRPTIASAVASDTPAASYVGATSPVNNQSVGWRSDEQLAVELRPPLRAAGDEAHERLAHMYAAVGVGLEVEDRRQRVRLLLRIVRLQLQLRHAQVGRSLEQLLDPVARRMQLEPVAGVRRDERPPAAVLLDAQLRVRRPVERRLELVLVEREPEMVDARQRPLSRLHDDVHRALFELAEPQLEPAVVQLGPGHTRLVGRQVLADAAVPRDEVEAQLADVPRLHLAHLARDEVVVEQVHEGPIVSRTRLQRVEAGMSSREPEREPPRRPRRLLDRAQPALLPRAARPARLPPGQRGRGRARRDY